MLKLAKMVWSPLAHMMDRISQYLFHFRLSVTSATIGYITKGLSLSLAVILRAMENYTTTDDFGLHQRVVVAS